MKLKKMLNRNKYLKKKTKKQIKLNINKYILINWINLNKNRQN